MILLRDLINSADHNGSAVPVGGTLLPEKRDRKLVPGDRTFSELPVISRWFPLERNLARPKGFGRIYCVFLVLVLILIGNVEDDVCRWRWRFYWTLVLQNRLLVAEG